MTAKEFALNAIKPYYQDPSLCGFTGDKCTYYTQNGKTCVLGKFLKDPKHHAQQNWQATTLLRDQGEDVLIDAAKGVLTYEQWGRLQSLHDEIAMAGKNGTDTLVRDAVTKLNLFTWEEFIS